MINLYSAKLFLKKCYQNRYSYDKIFFYRFEIERGGRACEK